MQPSPPPSLRTPSPITMPKAFRRVTGAHSIIAHLVLADIVGMLVWALIGALIWPLTWWLVRTTLHLFHTSLIFDLVLTVMLCCFGIGLFRRRMLKRSLDDAWAVPGTLIVLIGAGLVILWLVKPDWMALPVPIIPSFPGEAGSWKLLLVPQGAAIAFGLSVLAHLLVLWRAQRDSKVQLLSLSRAHLDGPIWYLLEHAYALYRKGLARFHPSPLFQLKTPPTFLYYQRQTGPDANVPSKPEQEMYWHDGNLVINQDYIGYKQEQADILLPLVARLLSDYNAPVLLVTSLFHLAHVARRTRLTAWLLAVPLFVQHTCEQHWSMLERERVLDRDWFAYACGEGPRLRRVLSLHLKERTQNTLPDHAIPTLAERIDHLDSLLGREEQQVQQLRNALPLAPPSTA